VQYDAMKWSVQLWSGGELHRRFWQHSKRSSKWKKRFSVPAGSIEQQ
jgi:hypothetical protein